MHMVDLRAEDEAAIRQVATLLVEDFATDFPGSWPDLDSALEEVRASFGEARISRVAFDEGGIVPGWIGGISQYRGHVWELHPLVVRVSHRGQGVGCALVADLEERVKERGGLTITLGTDDVFDQTSLSWINLYPQVWDHLAHLRNLSHHPYEFYQKQGYVIVGVMPDANGLGLPRYSHGKIGRAVNGLLLCEDGRAVAPDPVKGARNPEKKSGRSEIPDVDGKQPDHCCC